MFKIVHLKNIYGRRLCDSLHPTHRLLTREIDPLIDEYENTISSRKTLHGRNCHVKWPFLLLEKAT